MQNALIGRLPGCSTGRQCREAVRGRSMSVPQMWGVLCPAGLADFDQVWACLDRARGNRPHRHGLGRRKELRATGVLYVAVADRVDGDPTDVRACRQCPGQRECHRHRSSVRRPVQDNHAAVEPEPGRISVADNVDAHYVVYKSRGRLYGHQGCEGRVAPVAGLFALITWPRCIPGLPSTCRLHRSAADDQGGGSGLTL